MRKYFCDCWIICIEYVDGKSKKGKCIVKEENQRAGANHSGYDWNKVLIWACVLSLQTEIYQNGEGKGKIDCSVNEKAGIAKLPNRIIEIHVKAIYCTCVCLHLFKFLLHSIEMVNNLQDDFERVKRQTSSSYTQWKMNELKKQNEELQKQLEEKKNSLQSLQIQLESSILTESSMRSELVLVHSFHQGQGDQTQVQHQAQERKQQSIINKAKKIGWQMIECICQNIPEWNKQTQTIEKIKSNIPCMMENIKRVLIELFRQRSIKKSQSQSINQIVSSFITK